MNENSEMTVLYKNGCPSTAHPYSTPITGMQRTEGVLSDISEDNEGEKGLLRNPIFK